MSEQRSRRAFLATAGAAGASALAGCGGASGDASAPSTRRSDALTVFHAGSLTAAFDDLQAAYTETHDVSVAQESAGSVRSTKKITQPPHRPADVLAVADYRLLRDGLLPDYGDWYALFATNAMTVAYTPDSKYADEFARDNWWDVLARDDVAVGHSDPAVDPNGYRALMATRLGAVPFEGERLYDEATADAMAANAVVSASDEIDLLGQLRSGKLDYAWSYRSFAASHDVDTLDLQPEVDLSVATRPYAEHYASVSVEAGGATYTGAPIAYGITVPSTAEHPERGADWVAFALGDGADHLRANGFDVLDTAVVPNAHADAVPDAVLAHAEARETLGPLSL